MSRRTQLTTKYLFQILSQLSENFIFIYLGLDLFADTDLNFNPLFIIVAVFGICLARYLAVFPLSKAINWFIRMKARRRGVEVPDELPFSYQAMLFWAGLRGAVGVALAAGLSGVNGPTLRATVLVVVVLTVIIFGGTTARMLEIMNIRTGVVEEIDSDDEFDIEVTHGGTYYKRSDTGLGYTPRRSDQIPLDGVTNPQHSGPGERSHSYSSGHSRRPSPPHGHTRMYSAAYSSKDTKSRDRSSTATLLNGGGAALDSGNLSDGLNSDDEFGLPPSGRSRANQVAHPDDFELDLDGDDEETSPANSGSRLRRSPSHPSPAPNTPTPHAVASASASPSGAAQPALSAREALRDLFSGGASGDHAAWFRQIDEDYIKPRLLLDQSNHKGPGPGAV